MEQGMITTHLVLALLALGFFLLRVIPVLLKKTWQTEQGKLDKVLFIVQHINYTCLFFVGIWLFGRTEFRAEGWFYLKMLLVVALFYFSARGMKRKIQVPLAQRKVSLILGLVVFLAIIYLGYFKPHLF